MVRLFIRRTLAKLFGWDECCRNGQCQNWRRMYYWCVKFRSHWFISENRKLIVGSPAKIIREVSDEMIAWKTKGTAIYQELAREGHTAIQPCEPYTEFVEQTPKNCRLLRFGRNNGQISSFPLQSFFSTSVSLSESKKRKKKDFRCNLGRNFVAISPFFQNLKFEYFRNNKTSITKHQTPHIK